MIALINSIAKKEQNLIVHELEEHGIDGIVPSHGDIMVHPFTGREYTMQELSQKIERTIYSLNREGVEFEALL